MIAIMLAGDRRARKTTKPLQTQAIKRHLNPEEFKDAVFIVFSFSSLKVIALGDLCNKCGPFNTFFPQIRLVSLVKMQDRTDAPGDSS